MQERRPVTDDQSPSSSPVNATQQYGNNAAMANGKEMAQWQNTDFIANRKPQVRILLLAP